MPTYPTQLPAPLVSGYALQPQDVGIRTAMDSGIARTRKRFSARPITTVPVNWLMSQNQLAIFDAWMLAYASDWFFINLAGSLGIQTVQARLVGAWTSVPAGGSALWSVSATLEVRAFDALSAEQFDAALAFGTDDPLAAFPTYPTQLPAPLLSGYSLQPQDVGIRTSMDTGIAHIRKRFSARPITTVPVNWIMNQNQFALFDTWMLTNAREWFSIHLAGGLGLQTVLARLVGTWTSVPAGSSALWSVSATLEVRAFDALIAEQLEAVLAFGADDLLEAFPVLHSWVGGQNPPESYP